MKKLGYLILLGAFVTFLGFSEDENLLDNSFKFTYSTSKSVLIGDRVKFTEDFNGFKNLIAADLVLNLDTKKDGTQNPRPKKMIGSYYFFVYQRGVDPQFDLYLGKAQSQDKTKDFSNFNYVYGVEVANLSSVQIFESYSTYLLSGFEQQKNKAYEANQANFVDLPKKTSEELKSHLMISAGYASAWVAEKNPFVDKNEFTLNCVGGYLADAVTYVPALGGLLIGKRIPDKLIVTGIGVALAIGVKLVFYFPLNSCLEQYNYVQEGKVKVPKEVN